jgi:hypothetical protein
MIAMAKYRNKDMRSEQQQRAPHFAGGMAPGETDRERVAQRAYELYLERGAVDGRDMDDWFSAEREITGRVRGSSGNSPGE